VPKEGLETATAPVSTVEGADFGSSALPRTETATHNPPNPGLRLLRGVTKSRADWRLADLDRRAAELAAAGDSEALKALHETIGRLLGTGALTALRVKR
jgi:hypothetical protein